MKIKYKEVVEKEATLLEILDLKEDGDREEIRIEGENYTLGIWFYSILKTVQIINGEKNIVFSMDTTRGVSNKAIATIVEKVIRELKSQGEK